MSITLSKAVAKCRLCDHNIVQIDSTREHAIEVVTKAMEKHVAEKHPEAEAT